MLGLKQCLRPCQSPSVWPMFGLFRHMHLRDFRSSKMAAAKPPNIVIYSDGQPGKMTKALAKVLTPDRYAFLNLDDRRMASEPWKDNVQLLVIDDNRTFTDRVRLALLQYWTDGGKILAVGSGAGQCLDAFGAAVKFPVGGVRRKSVRVSHLVHGVVSFDLRTELLDLESRQPSVEAIALEEDTNAVVIGAVRSPDKDGLLVFSQVSLDGGSDVDVSLWTQLVLKDVLRAYFGLVCSPSDPGPPPGLGPCYVIASGPSTSEAFLRSWQRERLECPKVALRLGSQGLGQDGGHESKPEIALVMGQPPGSATSFRDELYFGHLKTRTLGRVVWYAEVLTSTMDLLDSPNIPPGVVCIAGRQTGGRGRGGHVWLSPSGCAMFSLQIRVPVGSALGQRMPFVQHLASLAAVDGVRSISGYENLDLRIKWPNDIYLGSSVKLGGVIVQSTVMDDAVLCTVGCGLNVSNAKPTVCLDDIIRAENPELPVLSRERVIASAINRMEDFVSVFQEGRSDVLLRKYYSRWLHSDARVQLTTPDGSVRPAIVRGLDDFGFLEVDVEGSGRRYSVQPDGNSFDMLHRLVIVRS